MDMLETGNYEQAAHANNRESNMTAEECVARTEPANCPGHSIVASNSHDECRDTGI